MSAYRGIITELFIARYAEMSLIVTFNHECVVFEECRLCIKARTCTKARSFYHLLLRLTILMEPNSIW